MKIPVIPAVCALILGLHHSGKGSVIWSDTFDGQTAGAHPLMDYSGGVAGNDYSVTPFNAGVSDFLVSDAVGNGTPSLSVVDTGTGTSDLATLTVTMNHFAPFEVGPTSATPVLRVTFDIRVDSFLAASTAQNPRFILRADNTNNTGTQVVVAFSYADLNDGDASTTDLTFFADTLTGGTTNLTPKNSTAIGLIPGVGWQPGFDFGTYNSGDATANDSNDEFYRVTFDYDSISGGISGSVTRLSTGATAAFPTGLAMNAGLVFNNASSSDRFLLASSAANTATAYFDNIVFEAVPEPTGALLLMSGLGLLGLHRPRR